MLLYGGTVVNAPYHANCGGNTAEPQDSWRTSAEPYLRRVSDQIPGTNRFYCDRRRGIDGRAPSAATSCATRSSRYVRTLPGGAGGVGAVTKSP